MNDDTIKIAIVDDAAGDVSDILRHVGKLAAEKEIIVYPASQSTLEARIYDGMHDVVLLNTRYTEAYCERILSMSLIKTTPKIVIGPPGSLITMTSLEEGLINCLSSEDISNLPSILDVLIKRKQRSRSERAPVLFAGQS